MIFLNAESFIEEAIESVFAQTYPHWELLLVDDGSTDRSTKIARQYAERYPEKARYLDHEGHQNLGMSTTRNLGIRNAQGAYISFLDADDVWLPRKLEYQVATIEVHPDVGFVCNPAQWWYGWTGNLADRSQDFIQDFDLPLNTIVKPPTILQCFLNDEWASLCDILVRREVVEAVGGYETDFRGMYEDQAFHAKLCLHEAAFVAHECWYRYRQHPKACTVTSHTTGQTEIARQIFLTWLEKYLLDQGFEKTEIWQMVQNRLWSYRHPIQFYLQEKREKLLRRVKGMIKTIARYGLPVSVREWLKAKRQGSSYSPPLHAVQLGSLNRVTPISKQFGFDRGLPIDRYYIAEFLSAHQDDIQERVLEIGDDNYTRQFGGDRVTKSDVLHVTEGNPQATIVGDLTCADHIPSDAFDCVLLPQTLHLIYDMKAALNTAYRILKPGGVLLTTFPGISQRAEDEWGSYWCWSLTTTSAQRLFEEVFPSSTLNIKAYGNVLASIAFLHGLAAEELRPADLNYADPCYETLIAVRAVKPEGSE